MAIPITRSGRTVTARDLSGKVLRTAECRSVETAVALETKLVGDREFAAWWISDAGPAFLETLPTTTERATASAPLQPKPKAPNQAAEKRPPKAAQAAAPQAEPRALQAIDTALLPTAPIPEPLPGSPHQDAAPVRSSVALDHPWYMLAGAYFLGFTALEVTKTCVKATSLGGINYAIKTLDRVLESPDKT